MGQKTWIVWAMAVFMSGCIEYSYRAEPAERTPYDWEWEKVRKCLAETARLSYYRAPKPTWQLPATTEQEGRGDCLNLATLLYQKMLRNGVKNGRIIFGHWNDSWHAWVQWHGYVLDPVASWAPIKPFADEYRPCWGYDLAGKYRFVEERTEERESAQN